MSAPRLSPDEVRKVARLARLELSPQQLDAYAHQLAGVLEYIERLRQLNLADVQPFTNPADAVNRLDDDNPSAEPGALGSTRLSPDHLMRIAPDDARRLPPFISVPKVLGDDGGA